MNKRLELVKETMSWVKEWFRQSIYHGSFQEGEEAFKPSMNDSFTAQ